MSVLTLAEIRRGIALLPASKRREQLEHWLENELLESFDDTNVLPATKAIGDRWAAISARAQERGIQLSVIDGLVAATALEHNIAVATRNVKDFTGLGLRSLTRGTRHERTAEQNWAWSSGVAERGGI